MIGGAHASRENRRRVKPSSQAVEEDLDAFISNPAASNTGQAQDACVDRACRISACLDCACRHGVVVTEEQRIICVSGQQKSGPSLTMLQ